MSTRNLKAQAQLRFTPPGGSETVHLLAVPFGVMREFRPSRLRRRFDWFAENEINRRIVTVGPGVEEIVWTHRLENEPVSFMDWLEIALTYDITTHYRVFTSGSEFPFRVVEIVGASPDEVLMNPDRQRWGGNDWEVALRARRTDGGTFDGLFPNSVLSG